jgi:hypothetical protein
MGLYEKFKDWYNVKSFKTFNLVFKEFSDLIIRIVSNNF